MSITHQIVIDKDGRPSAAIIPWDVFEEIQDLMDDAGSGDEESAAMEEAERDRRDGNDEAFVSLSTIKSRYGIG